MDAIDWQGLSNVLIVAGAVYSIRLGYLLYEHGVDSTTSTEAELKTRTVSITMNGAGPGLAAMFLGASILIAALLSTGARIGEEVRELGSVFDDLFSTPVLAAEPGDTNIKKAAEEILSVADVVPQAAVGDVAAAIRDESVAVLASLVEGNGAEDELQTLAAETGLGWNAYVAARGDDPELALAMLSLRTLGLATFGGSDLGSASLTPNGAEVAAYRVHR